MEVSRTEIEKLLKVEIPEELFLKALNFARGKQNYIFQTSKREIVLQKWYLIELVKGYVISLLFSQYTMELCAINE